MEESQLGCRIMSALLPQALRDINSTDIGATIHQDMPDSVRRRAAETLLPTQPSDAVWIWNNGSAEGGVPAGGSGALIVLPAGVEQ